MLIVELPFATPFRTSAKFTNPGAADTVSDVDKTAFRLMLPVFELRWACAIDGNPAVASRPARSAKRSTTRGCRESPINLRLDIGVEFRFSALRFRLRESACPQSLRGPRLPATRGGQNIHWLPALHFDNSTGRKLPSCLIRWSLEGLRLDVEHTRIGRCRQRQAGGVNRHGNRVGAMSGGESSRAA